MGWKITVSMKVGMLDVVMLAKEMDVDIVAGEEDVKGDTVVRMMVDVEEDMVVRIVVATIGQLCIKNLVNLKHLHHEEEVSFFVHSPFSFISII